MHFAQVPSARQMLPVEVSHSHPSTGSMLQLRWLAWHVSTSHWPLEHFTVCTAGNCVQSVAQSPQCVAVVCRSTSHPSLATRLQSAWFAPHRSPQAPPSHVTVALGPPAHAASQAPQLLVSYWVSIQLVPHV